MDKSRIMVLEKQVKVYGDFLIAIDVILETLKKYDNKQYNKRVIDSINKELYKVMPCMLGCENKEISLVNCYKAPVMSSDKFAYMCLFNHDRSVTIDNGCTNYVEEYQKDIYIEYVPCTKKIDYEKTKEGILKCKQQLKGSKEQLENNLLQNKQLEKDRKELRQAIEGYNKKLHYCMNDLRL